MTSSVSAQFAPRRRYVLATLLAGAFALLPAMLMPPAAGAAISPRRALADLNAMRARSGIPPVRRFSRKLNRGCRQHNRYMGSTGEFGHFQRRTSVYYTRAGARAAAASVISQPGALPSAAWGDTLYHRLALLQPRLRASGYNASNGYACLQVLRGISRSKRARARQPALYAWPPTGSTGHGPVFDANEFPDPLADAPGAAQLGTPITFSPNGPWKDWQRVRSSVAAANVVSDAGVAVPVSVSDMSSAHAAYLQGGFALLPRNRLDNDTWYTATATGTLKYNGRSWRFTSATRFQTGTDDLERW
ncbi:MAG: CAP domain-containing protein [Solirubrobacterales bacterium]